MATETKEERVPAPDDATFLEGLAARISSALYYGKLDEIGIKGSVSTGLRHDDYDRLRAMAKAMRIAALKSQIAELELA